MNKKELIERMEGLKNIFGNECEYVKIDFVIELASELDEPQPLKLKDIISRMKQLFPLSRSEWIDEILKEFGEEFGSIKYRSGYEQGKLEGAWVGNQLKDADKIRQELNKPVVKQFVADWYEEHKDNLEFNIFDYVYQFDQNAGFDFKDWFDDFNTKPIQTLVNMHQFGYEVEEEKRYIVSLKNGQPLVKAPLGGNFYFNQNITAGNCKATRKQLEEAGFGWVFDCEGVEVEEVE